MILKKKDKLKLLFDPQGFKLPYGGVARYFTEMMYQATKNKNVEVIFPVVYSENYHLREKNLGPKNLLTILNEKNYKYKFYLLKLVYKIQETYTIFKIWQNNFDVFIPTYYIPFFVNHLKKPFVLTVYDMIHEKFPDYFPVHDKTISQKLLTMKAAAKIIAISESTKNDILELYPEIPSQKIQVVYLAPSIEKGTILTTLPKKYLLFVGNRGLYKNFIRFFDAVVPLLQKDHDLVLLCAGGGTFYPHEIKSIEDNNLKSQVVQYRFKDSELHDIYKNAIAFVFPSEYEGFGIPVLESMISGCPAILSNVSSLPEIGGDAAVYFDPFNVEDIRNKVEKVLTDENLRSVMIEKGLRQAEVFTWEKTFEQFIAVAESVKIGG